MRYVEIIRDKDLQSLVLIAGFLVSFICNIIGAVAVLVFLLQKQPHRIRPLWLFAVNFVCFIFQLYFLSK